MSNRQNRPTVKEALAAIVAELRPLGTEQVALPDALGRLTATSVHAAIDVPRFAASAMDGYAVRAADTVAAPMGLPLVAPVAAGDWPEPLPSGVAAPISTGAPVPAGADAVLIREDARLVDRDGQRWLELSAPLVTGRNVRCIGEDAACGDEVLPSGRAITPDAIGALAAYGVERVMVRSRPRIGLISTGNELAATPSELSAGAILDCNGPMIDACCRGLGLETAFFGRIGDSGDAIDAMLDRMAVPEAGDVLLSSGGVSGGAHDLVADRLVRCGATIVFHGIRMRPGKPMLFAVLPDGRPFFGLPGNPVAALVAFRFFVTAALRRLSALEPETGRAVVARVQPRDGTTLFLRGISRSSKGEPIVDVDLDQRSHVQRSVLAADTWLRVEPDGTLLAYPKTGQLSPQNPTLQDRKELI